MAKNRFGDEVGDGSTNNFGDFTQSNRLSSKNPLRRRSSNKTNITKGSRSQAASGSLGTTTGDSSGTGVNSVSAPSSRPRGESRAGPTGETSSERSSRLATSSHADRIRRDINAGRISTRAGEKLINDRLADVSGAAEKRRATETTAGTAANRLGFDAQDSVADRQATLRSKLLDIQSSSDLEGTRQEGLDRRATGTNAISSRRNEIFQGQLDRGLAQDKLGQSNINREFEASQAAAESSAIASGQKFGAEQRDKRLTQSLKALGDLPSPEALASHQQLVNELFRDPNAATAQAEPSQVEKVSAALGDIEQESQSTPVAEEVPRQLSRRELQRQSRSDSNQARAAEVRASKISSVEARIKAGGSAREITSLRRQLRSLQGS